MSTNLPDVPVTMCSFGGLREFINDRLSAAAGEIFTVVQQTIVQYEEEVDAQKLDNIWREETKTHSTDNPQQHVCKEEQQGDQEINSSLNQEEREPAQIKDNQDQLIKRVKKEAGTLMVTVADEKRDHKENMVSYDSVREFIHERLTATAVEIFTVFEQTVIHFREEVDAQRRLLDTSCKKQTKFYKNDESQQHVCQEEQLCGQEINFNMDQEELKPPKIKEEPQELCSSLEEEQSELKQEADIFMVTVTDEQSEPDSEHGQLLSHDSDVDESQNQKRTHHVNSGASGHAELENVDNSPLVENQCGTDPGKKCLTCNICGKTFSFISQIQAHQRIHTGEKPYACGTCGKSFSQQSNLLRHIRTHTGEKPYSCETCGKSFSHHYSMLFHKRTHTGEKPFHCNICGKRFIDSSSLKKHTMSHTGEKPHSCEMCHKNFSTHGKLLRHIRTHTGEKPYTCDFCEKSFSQQSHLSRHMRNHTGEKPYSYMTYE